ncbi:ShlB/FhaC/HecB family hemolysin secretion/activation protein [Arsenophonus nasoniae]|uniref:ShlB/FhaC/HecB family hemolysin secretion/activation protein n=1 Tax=Arsenophonus nasoniae TaxID=638 RepID=UPI003879EE1F
MTPNYNVFCYLLITSFAQSATMDATQQQQKALLDEANQQRNALQKSPSFLVPLLPPIATDSHPAPCFTLRPIQFENARSLSPSTQSALKAAYLYRCLTLIDIQQLVRDITNTYIEKGYVTSQAYLPAQDIRQGTLRIAVMEGLTESVEIEGQPLRMVNMVFPNLTGQVLNLRDIEQGLEQLNRLASARYTIDIQPGMHPGYSRVLIRRQVDGLPGKINFSVDNSGQKSPPETKMQVGLVFDTPLGLGEQWQASLSRDVDFSASNSTRNLSASLSLPYGYWTGRYSYLHSTSPQSLTVMKKSYLYLGKNETHQLDVNRTMYRDRQQKLTLQVGGRHKTVKNKLAGQTLVTSSATFNTVFSQVQYSSVVAGGYLTVNPGVEYGLSIWDTTARHANRMAPQADFLKFTLSSSYFTLLTDNMSYLTSFYGQMTSHNLFLSERLSLGGLYSVRGYKEQTLSGNQGFYWRNEMSYPVIRQGALTVNLTGAVDYGYLHHQPKYGIERAHLLGSGVGLSASARLFNTQILLGKPLYYPTSLQPDRWSVYWSAGIEW